MDGFHLYRKDLSPEGIRFRGAAFTFDLQAFKEKIIELLQRKTYPIMFPSFDHAAKDPK
jgi:pantothenate kinase